jgi:hypothetical protein
VDFVLVDLAAKRNISYYIAEVIYDLHGLGVRVAGRNP